MSWRGVGGIYLVLTLLAGLVAIVGRAPIPESQPGAPPPPEASLLGTEPAAVRALTLRREGVEIRAAEEGGRWRVLAPEGAAVPADLLAALVGTLTAGQASDVIVDASEADLREFGLAAPRAEITVTLQPPRQSVRVLLGGANPTKTAIYAMREDRQTVFLVGLNVRYYADLIFEAVRTS